MLGSAGSVGTQTLDVVADHPELFAVVALAARQDSPLFREQVATHRPEIVSLKHSPNADFPVTRGTEVLSGDWGLTAAAVHPDADIVVVATSGHDAIVPTIHAIKAGKIIALANKETLVCAGDIIMPLVRAAGRPLRPVD
ncbi:MAG: 1-deoxy-D-xylulose-5-phosphate reductoisomerase, partial [Thermomicrobiales bacterium]